jgi:hypothetical protein
MKTTFNFLFSLIIVLVTVSCSSKITQIGRVNMVSNRNVNPNLEYMLIASYTGSKSDLKKSKAPTIEDAVDQAVRRVPGGEFLMNTKIFLVDGKYIAVEGDVWGNKEASHKGFKVGDRVTWKTAFQGYKEGVIRALKDDKTCIIMLENGNTTDKKYDEIIKAQ